MALFVTNLDTNIIMNMKTTFEFEKKEKKKRERKTTSVHFCKRDTVSGLG